MAYRVGLPKNKENFAEKPKSTSSLSLPKITGNSGNSGNIYSESAKLETCKRFSGPHHSMAISCDLESGEIVAVAIASEILGAEIWLSFRDDFNPADNRAIFYAHELSFLRNKTADQLRSIHKTKLTFGQGTKVRQ